MSQQDLHRTIQIQQGEINMLREQLARNQSANFQLKYKKALQQISGIIKANRQLKDQLNRLSSFRANEGENLSRINRQEIGKAYQKVLKEKNQLLGQKQALQLQNQSLRNSVLNLQETITKLKNEKLAIARQKEGIIKLNSLQKEGSSDRIKEKDFKQRQAELRKTLQNYEERHASLARNNRKLEQHINELENKLYNSESQFKNKLNQKDIEVKVSKSAARQQFQTQIANLKREISQLKSTNNQLSIKLNSFSESQRVTNEGPNQYEEQLIQTLRQLKMQMEPMSSQIAELQVKNQLEKEQSQRERANLQIKVMQYEAEIDRINQSHKLLQQKLLKEVQKTRKWDESERNIKKLEQQNKMLGGKVIVLEAKEVALRNRSGDQLQQRVLQFQTRVEMLLSDKQTVANMKNVNIHQLIALKAYILELDAKLKQVVNQNQYAVKKYKSYKQKCTQLIRELKQHDIAINALKGKLQGYDRLVVKLQGELQRAISINDSEMKAINVKITESTVNSIDIYKKKYQSLLQKLNLQEKYAEQQIQTLRLNYDTKILDLNLKLQELSSIRDTIGLYKSKNQQLSNKLALKENQLLQTKMTKVVISETIPQTKNPHKETINKLHQTINLKESTIIALENQIRKTQQDWKGKYNQLQLTTTATLSKKNRQDEDKKKQIEHLQNQIRLYRTKLNELESKTLNLPYKNEDQGYNKTHHYTGQISELQVQLEDLRNRYDIQVAKVSKLTKLNSQLKQANNQLQGEVSRLKYEIKRIDKQLHLQLQDKNNQIKRIQSKNQQTYLDSSRVQKTQSDSNNFKINSLKMQLQMLKDQAQQLQADKQKYYNRSIQLEKQVSQLSMKIQQITYTLQRTKNSISNDMMLRQTQKQQQIERLQYNLRSLKDKNTDLQSRTSQYEAQITRIRNQLSKQRQRLHIETEGKQEEISKLVREINRLRAQFNNIQDTKVGIQQDYQFKIGRLANQNSSLRDQISRLQTQLQRFEGQIKFLRNRELQYNTKAQGQQNYVFKLSNDIKQLQNKQIQMQSELMQKDSIITKLTNQLSYIRGQIQNISSTIQTKDNYISRLTVQNNTLRNAQVQLQVQISSRAGQQNKYNTQLQYAKSRALDLQHQLQTLKSQINRIKSQNIANEQNYSYQIAELQEKDSTIMRLQADIRTKTQQLNELTFQISGKDSKISELQNQSLRLRSISTDFQTEMLQKNGQISRLTYQLNSIRVKYQALESEHQNNDSNWITMNRELAAIRSQIGNYEDDLAMKNLTIQRYKGDIRDLTQQIQTINQQIYEKNKVINNLNQQLFKLKLEGQERSSEQIYRLQNEIYHLKSKVSNLQGQLQMKQQELSRAKLQISTVRSNVAVNRYSDEEYDMLQSQYYQLQKQLTQTRSQLSEKDLQVTQLQAKVQYMKRLQSDAKRRFNQQRHDLQTQLQNVLSRERQLRNQISELQNQAILTQNKTNDEQQWGMQLYQNQCDRLQKIVAQLQEQVNSLKLKLTYMTNQQDRIIQNLTLMTLTFAEVQALRERMKIKQSQISEVRKSLIHFATSNEEITSMGSRIIKNKANFDKEGQNYISGQKISIQQIQPNPLNFKKSQKSLFSYQQPTVNYQQNFTEVNTRTQFENINTNVAKVTYTQQYQSNASSARDRNYNQNFNYQYRPTNELYTAGFETQKRTDFVGYLIPEQVDKPRNIQVAEKTQKPSENYQQQDFNEQINEQYPEQQVLNNNYQNADRKLNQLVDSMTGQKKESAKSKADKQESQQGSLFSSNNFQNQIGQNIQISQSQQSQQLSVQQVDPRIQQTQQTQNLQNQQVFHQPQLTQQFQYQQTSNVLQNTNTSNIAAQKPFNTFQIQPQAQNQTYQASWRYGSSSQSNQQTYPIQTQPPSVIPQLTQSNQPLAATSTQQRVAHSQQQQVRINVGSSNQIVSAKALSPSPQASFSSTGPTIPFNVPQTQPIQIQGGYQNIQGRQYAVFQQQQQPLYPGFAR